MSVTEAVSVVELAPGAVNRTRLLLAGVGAAAPSVPAEVSAPQ